MNLPWWAWLIIGVVVGGTALYVGAWVWIIKDFEKWW